MSQVKSKKIRVKHQRETGYQPDPEELLVVQAWDPDNPVKPGDTVEILIPGSEGFTVYFPIGEHFDAQIFEAVKNPAWASEENAEELAAAAGSDVEPKKGNVWGVRMTRISEKCSELYKKEFPYCIYSKELKNFAVGNSPPRMTLEP